MGSVQNRHCGIREHERLRLHGYLHRSPPSPTHERKALCPRHQQRQIHGMYIGCIAACTSIHPQPTHCDLTSGRFSARDTRTIRVHLAPPPVPLPVPPPAARFSAASFIAYSSRGSDTSESTNISSRRTCWLDPPPGWGERAEVMQQHTCLEEIRGNQHTLRGRERGEGRRVRRPGLEEMREKQQIHRYRVISRPNLAPTAPVTHRTSSYSMAPPCPKTRGSPPGLNRRPPVPLMRRRCHHP